MLTVSSLAAPQLRAQLAGPGLRVRTGPFVACIGSRLPRVAAGVELLYADYPLLPEDAFADFHVGLARPASWRGWLRPQVQFSCDGAAPFQPLPLAQSFPMLEWGLNWCVSTQAHSWLVIHAAVVEKHGKAAILPAPPGSGKSTLCAALVNRGWRLLSDELALIRPDTVELEPLPRPVSLKNRSIDLIREFAPGAVFSESVRDTAKGTVAHMRAPADSVARAHETAEPAWIVFPRYEADAPPRLSEVAPARSFLRLAENAFNYSLLGATGFETVGRVIDRVRTYDFSYSRLDDALAVFDRLAEGSK